MWADVLGAALSTGSQLARQRRLDTQDEEERRLKMQREKQLIDLALRDQQMQEEESQRSIADRLLANIGPMGQVDAESAAAMRAGGLGGRLKEQEGTLSSTQFLPGAGGEARMSPSPGLQAGTFVAPNRMEQIGIDRENIATQERDRQAALREHLTKDPSALFAKGPMSAAVIWEQAGFKGSPPQDMKEAKDLIMFQHGLAMQRDAQRQDAAVEAAFARGANAGANRSNYMPVTMKNNLAQAMGSFDTLSRLKSLYKDDFIGPAAGRWNAIQAGSPEGIRPFVGQAPEGFAEFSAESATLKNSVIKAVTGAAMSEPEAQRILKQVPDVNDTPENWAAKAAATERNLQEIAARMYQISNSPTSDLSNANTQMQSLFGGVQPGTTVPFPVQPRQPGAPAVTKVGRDPQTGRLILPR